MLLAMPGVIMNSAGDGMVVEPSLDHCPQPLAYRSDRRVHETEQCSDPFQTA